MEQHTPHATGKVPWRRIASPAANGAFPGTALPNCQFLAQDIKTCQQKGKIITLSLGGATGSTSFSSDSQAEQFADTIWNLFLGGSSSTRPFGTAVLDGIDLDIETGDSNHYAAFVKRLRTHTDQASKKFYLTAAPQCVYPDAHVGTVLNAVPFDAVYVQFYNNYCGLQNYGNPNAWNYDTWDQWAKNSANKNVKIYIGAPASPTSAGSGYVDAATLGRIAKETRAKYPSSFGGVMLWDASQAYGVFSASRACRDETDGLCLQITAALISRSRARWALVSRAALLITPPPSSPGRRGSPRSRLVPRHEYELE
ncbi:hypothetical protein C0992_003393 [Termitomyces sp. T32_za158]|nr:hypothetical protein C0992_003393 [Termitomyces sp. T32_za158]